MKQFNKLIEFRQAVYDHGLARFADAQFDLVDALLFSPPIRSFPELSLSAAFRRQWHSAYAAIEEGRQDWEWLEPFFIHQIPPQGLQVFSLDGTSWLHSAAKAMADRQYVYSPTKMVNSRSIGIGHPYSVLAWVPERTIVSTIRDAIVVVIPFSKVRNYGHILSLYIKYHFREYCCGTISICQLPTHKLGPRSGASFQEDRGTFLTGDAYLITARSTYLIGASPLSSIVIIGSRLHSPAQPDVVRTISPAFSFSTSSSIVLMIFLAPAAIPHVPM